MYKRGQMKLSFGMIFSIFLIIVFIAFAFYAISKIVNLQKGIQVEQFVDNLQQDVKKVWLSSKSSQEETYSLPDNIDSICFRKDEFNNLIFRSSEFVDSRNIKYLDILKITAGGEDPYCINNIDGKIKLSLKKDFGETLVTITR